MTALPITEDWTTADWPSLLAPLARTQSAQEFAALLAGGVLNLSRAHGVRVCLLAAEAEPTALAETGRGLALCDSALGGRARQEGGRASSGMHEALLIGPLLLDAVGADPSALNGLEALAPLLGLAFEGVQAREARRGTGREQETMTRLVRRMGGSLELPQLLSATAETAAQALGFDRAFVGLLDTAHEVSPPRSARTGEVFTHGFEDSFSGGVGIGPASFERLFGKGEAIVYERGNDVGGRMGAGLAELDPETAVIAPLSVRGRPLGVLYADTRRKVTITDDDLWLVLSLAEQASLSIDNARLYAEETRKRQSAEAMREVGNKLASSLHLGQTYAAVLERAAELFGADACAVYELQPDGRTLTIRSAVGLSSEYVLRSRVKLGAGVVGRAVARAEAVAVRDFVTEGPGGGSRYTRQLLAQGRYPFKGVLGLPLGVRGRVLGGLALYFQEALPLSRDDLSLAEVFAAQAALAIENARLYEEEVRRERESAALLGVARLQSQEHGGPDLQETVRLAVQAMNGERGLLLLYAPPDDLGSAGLNHADDGLPELGTYNLPFGLNDLSGLQSQLGRGPRRLTRRHALPGAASALIVPIRSGQETLGLLYVDHPGEESPTDRILALGRAIADQVALACTRSRLLAALERQEARYRQLAEGAHDLIIAADAQGQVQYANPACERLMGDLTGHNLHALLKGQSLSDFRAAWLTCQDAPESGGRCELRLSSLTRTLHLEVRLSKVMPGGGMLLVARDISELELLMNEINRRAIEMERADERQLELRSFLSLFTQAQEEERGRISRELHDDTAQVLVAIGRRIDRLSRDLGGETRERADDIRQDLNGAIEGVRRFARNLRPSVLDDLGLLPALEWLASQAATPTRLEIQGSERRLPAAAEMTLFRMVQEGLGNTDRHAHASFAAIRVLFSETEVTVTLTDDGVGFSPEQARRQAQAGHLGLTGMRERVLLAGGWLEVSSQPGQGSLLQFSLPG
ncbi:GAF domain-containing protein [Deinococcus radiomollis]|uniref:GAF domain-containing protein n=1 Tax=Deinococcus radiomollis TaxID=468916 RepID=UPI0038919C84